MAEITDLTTRSDERVIADVVALASQGEPIPDALGARFEVAAARLLRTTPGERVTVRCPDGAITLIRPTTPAAWWRTRDGVVRTTILLGMACGTAATCFSGSPFQKRRKPRV